MQGNPEELGKSACYLYFQLFMMIFENLVCTLNFQNGIQNLIVEFLLDLLSLTWCHCL